MTFVNVSHRETHFSKNNPGKHTLQKLSGIVLVFIFLLPKVSSRLYKGHPIDQD